MATKASSESHHLGLLTQFVLLLQTFYFFFLIATYTFIQWVMNSGLNSPDAPAWAYLRSFYHIPLSMVIFSLGVVLTISAIVFYTRWKILAWLALVYSLFAGVFANWALTQWQHAISTFASEKPSPSQFLDLNQKFMFILPILFPLILLLFLDRKNPSTKTLTHTKFKFFIFSLTLLIFGIAPVSYYAYTTYTAWHPTYNFSAIQKSLSYYLYFPTIFPKDKAIVQNFTTLKYQNLTWAKTTLGTPVYIPLNPDYPGIMFIYQTQLPPNFDLKTFAKTNYVDDSIAVTNMDVNNEFTDHLFLKSIQKPNWAKRLLLVTKHNTLIEIGGVSFPDEDFALVANGLK